MEKLLIRNKNFALERLKIVKYISNRELLEELAISDSSIRVQQAAFKRLKSIAPKSKEFKRLNKYLIKQAKKA